MYTAREERSMQNVKKDSVILTVEEFERLKRVEDSVIAYKALAGLYELKAKEQSFYNSPDWKKTRIKARERDCYIDVWRWIKDREIYEIVSGEKAYVHHIESVRENWDARLSLDNLVTLSAKSHGEIESLYNKCPEQKPIIQELLRKAVRELEYVKELGDDL